MLTQELIDSRKRSYQYQIALNDKINQIIEPLRCVNIDWFMFGRFYLDEHQKCKKLFMIDSKLEAAEWVCNYATDNGIDFTLALRHVPLDQETYFIPSKNTSDPIIQVLRKIGLSDGLCIWYRQNNIIEWWNFFSTFEYSILSSPVINMKNINAILKLKNYLKDKLYDLDLNYQIFIEFPCKIDFSFLPYKVNEQGLNNFFDQYNKNINLNNKTLTLTKREWECWRLLALGQTAKTIGNQLNITPRTVEFYIQKLKQKIDIYDKASLARLFYDNFKEWI